MAEILGPDIEVCVFVMGKKQCLCQTPKELRAFKTKQGKEEGINHPSFPQEDATQNANLAESYPRCPCVFNDFAN